MIGNRIFIAAWRVLTILPVPRDYVVQNSRHNAEILQQQSILETHIERQCELENLHLGKGYNYAYSGCSIIALFNALKSLGEPTDGQKLLEMQGWFETHGMAMFGHFGIVPTAMKRYLLQEGFRVTSCFGGSRQQLDLLGEMSDTFVVVVCNGKIRHGFHAVNIEKLEKNFLIHNGNSREPNASLSEAVTKVSSRGSWAVYVIGIDKRK